MSLPMSLLSALKVEVAKCKGLDKHLALVVVNELDTYEEISNTLAGSLTQIKYSATYYRTFKGQSGSIVLTQCHSEHSAMNHMGLQYQTVILCSSLSDYSRQYLRSRLRGTTDLTYMEVL